MTETTESGSYFLELCDQDCSAENYDKWASSYDADMNSIDYSGYKSINSKWRSYHQELGSNQAATKHRILDAGCGTGLLGEDLVKLVPHELIEIYGGDMSPKMLDIARGRKIYADLRIMNLREELPYKANFFDSILCAGVLAPMSYPGPECLPNLIGLLKEGSYFFATVRQDYYEESKLEWDKQVEYCNCKLVEEDQIFYLNDARGLVIVMQKQCPQ